MHTRYQRAPYVGTVRVDRKIKLSGTTESIFSTIRLMFSDMRRFCICAPLSVRNSLSGKSALCAIPNATPK